MRPSLLLAAALLSCLVRAAAQDGPFGPLAVVVGTACGDCHDATAQKGGLDLAAAPSGDVARLTLLARVRDRVAAGEMPPGEAEPLPAEQRARLLAFCAEVLARDVPRLPRAPAPVTVRRLSRGQWEHTVFDVFGARAAAAAAFPADDLGYGFDTIGDALSFSTLHLEKYLDAAREVAEQVFATEHGGPAVTRREAGRMALVAGPGAELGGDAALLYANATIQTTVAVPRDGVYRLRVAAGADAAGDEPAKFALLLDGRQLDVVEVAQRELRPVQFTVPLDAGPRQLGVAFVNDFWDPDNPDPQRRDRNLHVGWLEVEGPIDAGPPPSQRDWLRALPSDGAPTERIAALAAAVAPRVFRRAPRGDEVARLAAVGDAALRRGAPFHRAAQDLLTAALASPSFLFRVETPPVAGRLAAEDIAGRLAYFVWSSCPDEVLLAAAADGRLDEPVELDRQLDRMLADARADRLATEFAAQWLELRSLDVRTPDPQRFPGFDDALRRSLRRETELLFLAVLRDGRDVRDLLDCDFTHVDARLAAFYGIDGSFDAAFVRVALPPGLRHRGGVLGQASMHAVTANPTRTSPVKRGKWILENLLGQAPPAPPPGSDRLPDEARAASPRALRAQLAQHRERAACASCHARMDAFGLLLENFDAIGRWRDRDDDGAIDASSELPDGRRLDGIDDLKHALAAEPAFPRTLARKLFVFGVGREPSPQDRLALDLAVDALVAAGPVTIAGLVRAVVHSDAFLLGARMP